ncbi:MAG: hypothetical protein HKM93_00205 [Desulfobacteraceae bacterium]|nr:hypothetical protein [Desulfobacteraceae bacterium]
MADNIISIDKKLQLNKKKKAALEKRHKIMAVRKIFQCTHCASKCEKCGTQVSSVPGGDHTNRRIIPYRFCESCRTEYIDYIDRLQGRGDNQNYWHNESWITVWSTWIEYQNAIDQYLKSKEFVKLLDELRDDEA